MEIFYRLDNWFWRKVKVSFLAFSPFVISLHSHGKLQQQTALERKLRLYYFPCRKMNYPRSQRSSLSRTSVTS